ncbi:Glycerol-3-phosphate acyltransferase [Terrisporobacter petrolearius]|uniref:Glycerol-3-phosphate acyltransferase n=1 Tax=Terrisporobacter hibernicus TaxID=2813371 RepID=A0AAX2ZBZ5_9FIRM|nr:glycerol-3-phosphate 1-O-acyltransferase PlsY [Terrisporobacter hibernicus]MBN9646576.1 glycerol-3-phosphate 1-O-acyltransferase PlsY [Terrisporobacter glycolicus]UEL46773.1 glycerol-3-phosphate 1-O-acyltransferase PlsY [Terrisporobacter hibernicus]SFJ01183.1 glycerol-3-phosphate acyltransferase PlsY [Terrisporobacter glycolicus]
MLIYLIIIIIAYLLGNISTSYIVAKRLAGVDIRTQGSGNAGSTNVLRTLGKKAGALTFIGDVLKGLIAVLLARLIAYGVHMDQSICAYFAVVAVVLGHNYPAFLGFKGGKGVATSLGSMLGMNPLVAIICLAFFIIVVAITKYVSLGSILGIGLSPIIMLINHNTKGFLVALILTISVAITHKENIKRLINGTERKIGEKKN